MTPTDLLACIAVMAIVHLGLAAWSVRGSGVAAVAAGWAFATWRLHAAGTGWSELGLALPDPWWLLPLGVVALYVTTTLAVGLIVGPLARARRWPPPDTAHLGELRGNPRRLALLLSLAWTSAAFGEELVFRAFLQTGFEAAFGGGTAGLVAAIALQSVLFGAAHHRQGPRGVAQAMVVGSVFGVGYVLLDRNLWPLIVAHGLINTFSLVAIYAGADLRAADGRDADTGATRPD